MRELKFRAWDNRMYYDVVPLSNTEIIEVQSLTGNARVQHVTEVMQFTGLQDVHDKDVYEGDIIHDLWYPEQYFYVDFSEGSFLLLSFKPSPEGSEAIDFVGEMEVVGDIYSNPELLSEKTEVKK